MIFNSYERKKFSQELITIKMPFRILDLEFIYFYFYYKFGWGLVVMGMCECRYPGRPEEFAGFSGTGVAGVLSYLM